MQERELYFKDTIDGWESWCKVYQSIESFKPLIEKIFKKETLALSEVEHLTPGTNAVFKVGVFVIKIFAPYESGIESDDYSNELEAMKHASRQGIRAPKVISASTIDDKYWFKYIIMEYLEGIEGGVLLKKFTKEEKITFAHELRKAVDNLHVLTEEHNRQSLEEKVRLNHRWNRFHPTIKEQVIEKLNSCNFDAFVTVHGDLTGDNVLIDDDKKLTIIDFADSCIAPQLYEYPPIVFDLFDFDLTLITAYFHDYSLEEVIDACYKGLMIHDFGANFIALILERNGLELTHLKDLNELKSLIKNLLG